MQLPAGWKNQKNIYDLEEKIMKNNEAEQKEEKRSYGI